MVKIMLNRMEILNLANNYVLSCAEQKPFNIQMKAILNFYSKNSVNEKYLKKFHEFISLDEMKVCKDFVYKNNLSTFRKFYIVPPEIYMYYTFQVFEIYFLKYEDIFNTGYKNIKIFYSGYITDDKNKVKENCVFDNQFSLFKEEQKSFKNKYVLSIDLESFFDNITIINLLEKLSSENHRIKQNVKNLKEMFEYFGIETLPQLHYSIASSILSQIYLHEFTTELDNILGENGWESVRYVDDHYICLNKKNKIKDTNLFLHKITDLLYRENLGINQNKTKRYTPTAYEKFIEEIQSVKNYETFSYKRKKYKVNIEIEKKVEYLVQNNGEKFEKFIDEISLIYQKFGLDIKKYLIKEKEYLSINGEDASKVINHLKYSGEWKLFNKDLQMKIINCKELMFFDPIKFVALYCFINNFLNKKYSENHIQTFINFYSANLRLLIIAEQLLIQGMLKKEEWVSIKCYFEKMDPNSLEFYETYLKFNQNEDRK